MFNGKDIFEKLSDTPKPGFTVGLILGLPETEGDVGIEIEVEGKKLPKANATPPPWVYHQDGSLRGEENGEYVLKNPLQFAEVPAALATLWDEGFKAKSSILDESNRTSVHVHLNCQEFHLNRLASFAAMYFALEEILTNWCGEHRVGNLFCLRGLDAPGIVTQLKKFIQTDGVYQLRENTLHYAGFNAAALRKFGSIEIRTMRGVSDPKIIEDWVAILQRLYELSAEYPDPREVCYIFSAGGPFDFFKTVLGDKAAVVQQGCGMSEEDIGNSLYSGVRLAQDICFCRDWGMYEAMVLNKDPFGRAKSKIASKLSAAQFPMMPSIAQAQMPDFEFEEEPEPEYDDIPEELPMPQASAPYDPFPPTSSGWL